MRRANGLWLFVSSGESLGIVTHPKAVKSAVGGSWERTGEGREVEWWTTDSRYGLVLLPVIDEDTVADFVESLADDELGSRDA